MYRRHLFSYGGLKYRISLVATLKTNVGRMRANNNELLHVKYILNKRTYLHIIVGVPTKRGTRVIPAKNRNDKKHIKDALKHTWQRLSHGPFEKNMKLTNSFAF